MTLNCRRSTFCHQCCWRWICYLVEIIINQWKSCNGIISFEKN